MTYKNNLKSIFFNNIPNIQELPYLLAKFNFTTTQILEKYYDYNLLINENSNEIYDNMFIRFVLFVHNNLKDSWHIEKQTLVNRLITQSNKKRILELGFGVPSLYVKNNANQLDITLSDYSDESIEFAKELLNIWSIRNVTMLKQDMRNMDDLKNYDLFIFLDSIEHVPAPSDCLKKYVAYSCKDSMFIISIPICPLIPMHTIHWNNTEEADEWLKDCGLEIINSEIVLPNYNVDIFANLLEDKIFNYVVLCKKTGIS